MLALCLAVRPSQAQDCPARLRVAFPDSSAEPFIRGQGEAFAAPPGLLVEWLRVALHEMGCLERAELVRLPARRVRVMVETGQVDLVAGVSASGPMGELLAMPPREGRNGEFDFSLGEVELSLYARRGTLARWDGRTLPALAEGARLGVMAGGRAEMLARERGWPAELAPSQETALLKLQAGRTSLLLGQSYFLDERVQADARMARQIVKLQPSVERLRLHVGVARSLLRDEPAFARRLWLHLCQQSQASRIEGACRMPLP